MPISFVRKTDGTFTVGPHTITLGAASSVGNVLVALIGYHGATAVPASVTDDGGNTWTLAGQRLDASNAFGADVWFANTTAIATTVTFTFTDGTLDDACVRVVELDTSGATAFLDVFKSAETTTTSADSGASVPTVQSDEFAFGLIVARDKPLGFSGQSSGYSLDASDLAGSAHLSFDSAHKRLSSVGAQRYAATLTPGSPPPGPPINQQSDIVSGVHTYNGGHCSTRIVLPSGTTWSNGTVAASGTFTGSTKGALYLNSNCVLNGVTVDGTNVQTGTQEGVVAVNTGCTLNDCDVSGGAKAFAAVYRAVEGTTVAINRGRYHGAAILGIGTGRGTWTLTGTEIDHNGLAASGGFFGGGWYDNEAGGIKGVGSIVLTGSCNIHHNLGGPGAWWDINGTGGIDNCTVAHNELAGAMFEISQVWDCHDNTFTGNGYGKDTFGWGSQVLVSASSSVQVYNNICDTVHDLTHHGNGITVVQQSRTDHSPPTHICHDIDIHTNTVSGPGDSGRFADSGGTSFLVAHGYSGICDATLNITFASDTWNSPHNHTDACGALS